MAQFLDEIWLRIVVHLTPSHHLQDLEEYKVKQHALASLCLVSKAHHAIAQPALYRTFVKFGSPRLAEKDFVNNFEISLMKISLQIRQNTRLEKFLRTLIQQPQLACNVKHVRIDHYYFCHSRRPGFGLVGKSPFDPVLGEDFVLALRDVTGPSRHRYPAHLLWAQCLKTGQEEAELALLLAILPNLRSLDLEASDSDPGRRGFCVSLLFKSTASYRAWAFHDISTDHAPVFSHLEVFNVRPPSIQESLVSMPDCIPLLTLPTLRSFTAHGMRFHYHVTPPNHLRHLKFEYSVTDGPFLETLLKTSSSLETLEINSHFVTNPHIPYDRVKRWLTITSQHQSTFQNALNKVSGTLQRLVLAMPEYVFGRVLDLHTFTKLRHLELEMKALLGNTNSQPPDFTTLLPYGLEHLCLRRSYYETVIKSAITLLQAVPSSFSHLKTLKIGFAWPEDHTVDAQGNLVEMGSIVVSPNGDVLANGPVDSEWLKDDSGNTSALQGLAVEVGVTLELWDEELYVEHWHDLEGW